MLDRVEARAGAAERFGWSPQAAPKVKNPDAPAAYPKRTYVFHVGGCHVASVAAKTASDHPSGTPALRIPS